MDDDLIVDLVDDEILLSNSPHQALTKKHPNTHNHVQGGSIQRTNPEAGHVITKIEDMLEAMIDCFIDDKAELVIHLKSGRQKKRVGLPKSEAIETQRPSSGITTVRFPGRNEKEAWKFTVLLRILELSHEALVTGTITTKRDIYYRDPGLFLKQDVVDRYIEDLAYTFGVERDALNVVAAAKGLIAGNIIIIKQDGAAMDCREDTEGILLSNVRDISFLNTGRARWVLVIEKEATFRTLSSSQYWNNSKAGSGILITAKGYPDVATRTLLHHLHLSHPELPIHTLVDYDPDGLSIHTTYAQGSLSLSHQSHNLAIPNLHYLGIRSSDFASDVKLEGGVLNLTKRDRRKAVCMLERREEAGIDGMKEEAVESAVEWRREVQIMLFMNVKAEIQVLGNGERLMEFLDRRLCGL